MASGHTGNPSNSFRPFNIPGNADRLNEVARKELGETEDLKKECLRQLRTLIKDNNVACITEDDFLLRFLRTKKFDVERSFQTVQNYAKQRAALHSGFLKLQPETVQTVLRRNILGFLPYRDEDERLILFEVTRSWNPDICTDEDFLKILLLSLYYAAEKQSSQTTGLTFIIDAVNIPWRILPHAIKHIPTAASVLFNGLPVRYNDLHTINETPAFRFFELLTRPFIPQKLKQRIHLHGESRKIVFQRFAPTILPDEFGGSLGPLNSDHLIEELLDYFEKFKDEQRHFLAKIV